MSERSSPGVALDRVEVTARLAARGCGLGSPLHLLRATGSTNDDAKAGAREGAPHGAVWVAEEQSRGRGRAGRAWTSPPGEGLLFSVLLRTSCAPPRVPPLSLVCGLAVRDAVARALGRGGERALVKWPNDVVILEPTAPAGFRKVAGVLVESAIAGQAVEHLIVGVGINVHTRCFPAELEATATSIAREGVEAPDRAELLAAVLTALERDVERAARSGLSGVIDRLSACDALSGRTLTSDDGSLSGVGCGIDGDGRLLVRRADGVVTTIASGEVRIRAA